jgi:CelD/BcsL family acetyltransferase involved in cellulose biosynthesis
VRLEHWDLDQFERGAPEWDALAAEGGSPFSSTAWLASWWRAFAPRNGVALVLSDDDGKMLAGACFAGLSRGRLDAAANAHSNDWGMLCRDSAAARRFWEEVAALGYRQLTQRPLLNDGPGASATREALGAGGYRLVEEALEPSPWLELPDSLDALLADRSRNLRSQVARRRRALQREGELRLRAVHGGPNLQQDLEAFFELEAAGWKGEEGTAIAADNALAEFYRGFASRAAASGWLRLYMLELDGRLVAADYGCVFDGCGYLVKTAFDEDLGRLAPGLVLRAEVLGSSIEEGLDRYDFLGGPDAYKLRWADETRGRSALRAFRGIRGAPAHAWWASLRPAAKSVRTLARRLPRSRSG